MSRRTDVYGTPDFIREDCTPNTDVKFVFGLIEGELEKILPFDDEYIATAILQNYDRTNMKGKGIVYIASPKSEALANLDDQFICPENLWMKNDGAILHAVLAHEVGPPISWVVGTLLTIL